MEIGEAFGEVIRELRTRAELSQEELANQSGLHRTYVSLLERGLRMPSLSTIFSLSKPLHVQPQDIVSSVVKKVDYR